MTDNETVGEYLARARTLFKAKLRYAAQWNTEYNESNIYYVIQSQAIELEEENLQQNTILQIIQRLLQQHQ